MKKKVGSDFSGVGAFDQALRRLEIEYETVFACDMDKYARETYIHNYGEPKYYPENVYDREIPKESLDIYMTSPPCQAFSLAGKRKGEDDKRGVLFYNSHEFIVKNKPRYFIFENVKGLLSDDKGKTFQRWVDFLGGKSVNGNPVIFPMNESVPYHIYHKVLNAKDYGVPQNRERVFIIGIRDDEDNDFSFPKPFHLNKRLKDILEENVDEKYYLSDKNIEALIVYNERQVENNRGFSAKFRDIDNVETMDALKVGGGGKDDLIKVKSATKKEELIAIAAMRGRNPENTSDRTTGAPMQQTLEINKNGTSNTITSVQKDNYVIHSNPVVEYQLTGGKWDKTHEQSGRVYSKEGVSPTIHTMQGGNQEPKIVEQINPSKESGGVQPFQHNRVYYGDIVGNLDTECGRPSYVVDYRIRKLTPRECFNLMDFPDSFTWPVSNSQAYKQAGNSIVVNVLSEIIKKLKVKRNEKKKNKQRIL
jgi:DNA (cytosine-5)-methyltransferase 1